MSIIFHIYYCTISLKDADFVYTFYSWPTRVTLLSFFRMFSLVYKFFKKILLYWIGWKLIILFFEKIWKRFQWSKMRWDLLWEVDVGKNSKKRIRVSQVIPVFSLQLRFSNADMLGRTSTFDYRIIFSNKTQLRRDDWNYDCLEVCLFFQKCSCHQFSSIVYFNCHLKKKRLMYFLDFHSITQTSRRTNALFDKIGWDQQKIFYLQIIFVPSLYVLIRFVCLNWNRQYLCFINGSVFYCNTFSWN